MKNKIARLSQELHLQSRNNYALQLEVECLNEQLANYASRLGLLHVREEVDGSQSA